MLWDNENRFLVFTFLVPVVILRTLSRLLSEIKLFPLLSLFSCESCSQLLTVALVLAQVFQPRNIPVLGEGESCCMQYSERGSTVRMPYACLMLPLTCCLWNPARWAFSLAAATCRARGSRSFGGDRACLKFLLCVVSYSSRC